ncbi:MAG: hypothetical protein ABI091_06710, partial [Ferruginibacter sp.]
MNKKLLFFLSIIAIISLTYKLTIKNNILINANKASKDKLLKTPLPTEGEENEELREKYFALRHRSAPGISWENIENQNMIQVATSLQRQTFTSNFANGNISGSWSARGANNITGSVRCVDYVPLTNTIYC